MTHKPHDSLSVLIAAAGPKHAPGGGMGGMDDFVRQHGEAPHEDMHEEAGVEAASAFAEAVKNGDPKAIWSAFHQLFQVADAMPHEEGPHEDDEEEEGGEAYSRGGHVMPDRC